MNSKATMLAKIFKQNQSAVKVTFYNNLIMHINRALLIWEHVTSEVEHMGKVAMDMKNILIILMILNQSRLSSRFHQRKILTISCQRKVSGQKDSTSGLQEDGSQIEMTSWKMI
jgi:hypothetical protein